MDILWFIVLCSIRDKGVLAARRAGMRVVAVPNPITALGTIERASLVLSSLAEMPLEDLLKQVKIEIRRER